MFDDVFEKTPVRRKIPELLATEGTEQEDNLGSFGWLRGTRDRAIMLEIHHKDGSITANAYAWLKSARFDPSEGITLDFSGGQADRPGLNHEIRPNMRLLNGILRHRVPWIREADGPTLMEKRVQNHDRATLKFAHAC